MERKIIIILITLVVLTIILHFLGFFEKKTPEFKEEKYIAGNVYEISKKSILVAEGVVTEDYNGRLEDLSGNAGWFKVEENTEITDSNGNSLVLEDIKKDDYVEIWTMGLVMESYPVQATASKIFIKERSAEKKCFVGGCSGELCVDVPEMASTCEFLPGMECLKEEMICKSVDEGCDWVLSEEAAKCFLKIVEEEGEGVKETRIGHLFQKAEDFFD